MNYPLRLTLALLSILAALAAPLPGAAVPSAPVTPDPTPEAAALLRLLYSISGNHTLTGQHNFPK